MAERKAEGEAKQKEAKARQREAENSFENVAREWWKNGNSVDTTIRRCKLMCSPPRVKMT